MQLTAVPSNTIREKFLLQKKNGDFGDVLIRKKSAVMLIKFAVI